MNEVQKIIDQMASPEGRAFSDYIEGIDCNPYPAGSSDRLRYDDAMRDMPARASE